MKLDMYLAARNFEGLQRSDEELLAVGHEAGLLGDPLLESARRAAAWAQPPWWAVASPEAAGEWRRSFEVVYAAAVAAGALAVALPEAAERRVKLPLPRAASVISGMQGRHETSGYEPFGVDKQAACDQAYEVLLGVEFPQVPAVGAYDVDRRSEWAEALAPSLVFAAVLGAVAIVGEPAEA